MLNKIRDYCRDLLESKKVEGILAVYTENGNYFPYFFTKKEELNNLCIDKKYLLLNSVKPLRENMVFLLQSKMPGKRIGILARGCDERSLFELSKRGQVNLDNIEIIGYSCNEEQAKICTCPTPYPTVNLKFGEKVEGVSEHKRWKEFSQLDIEGKRKFWEKEFSKCIKCFGCRNACPICFCKECLMEDRKFVKGGELPVEIPSFHFVQRYHHAAQCISCGECEIVCPMDIPLRLISVVLLDRVKKLYDYTPGMNPKQECPIYTIKEERNEEALDELL